MRSTRSVLGEAAQLLVMAAVVATLLYWPLGIVLAVVFAIVGVPLEGLLTFGSRLGVFAGMLIWWLIGFAVALAYSACVFPWGAGPIASSPKDSPWPRKK